MREWLKVAAVVIALCLLGAATGMLVDIAYQPSALENPEHYPERYHNTSREQGASAQLSSTTDQRQAEKSSKEGAQEAHGANTDNADWINQYGAIVATVVAVIYGVQAYLMRQTMISSNRAFVHFQIWQPQWDYLDESHHDQITGWRFIPRWENTGRTPTRRLLHKTNFGVFSSILPEQLALQDVDESVHKAILGPDMHFLGGAAVFAIEHLLDAKAEKAFLYIWGWVEYNDVFALTPRHRTEFFHRVLVRGDPRYKDCTFGFAHHGEHNNADEECKRSKRQSVPIGMVIQSHPPHSGDPTPL